MDTIIEKFTTHLQAVRIAAATVITPAVSFKVSPSDIYKALIETIPTAKPEIVGNFFTKLIEKKILTEEEAEILKNGGQLAGSEQAKKRGRPAKAAQEETAKTETKAASSQSTPVGLELKLETLDGAVGALQAEVNTLKGMLEIHSDILMAVLRAVTPFDEVTTLQQAAEQLAPFRGDAGK